MTASHHRPNLGANKLFNLFVALWLLILSPMTGRNIKDLMILLALFNA